MGRNNLEDRSKDYNWALNERTNALFKFELLDDSDCRDIEVASGLNMMQVTRAIQINSKTDIKDKDVLRLKGHKFKVIAISDVKDNPEQGRFKGNLDDFTGYLRIGLQ